MLVVQHATPLALMARRGQTQGRHSEFCLWPHVCCCQNRFLWPQESSKLGPHRGPNWETKGLLCFTGILLCSEALVTSPSAYQCYLLTGSSCSLILPQLSRLPVCKGQGRTGDGSACCSFCLSLDPGERVRGALPFCGLFLII